MIVDRFILTGSNKNFPRAALSPARPASPSQGLPSVSGGAGTHSGVVPDSAAGGSCHPVETPNAPKGAGSTRVRRPRATVKQAMGVVFLWDSGEFDTVEIAKAMGLHEAEVESVLHHIREERRARA